MAGLGLCCAGCATMALWEKTEKVKVEIHDARIAVGDRNLLNWGGKTKDSLMLAEDLARQCTLKYEDSVQYRSHNKVHNIPEMPPLSDQDEYAIMLTSTRETQSKRSETLAVRLGS